MLDEINYLNQFRLSAAWKELEAIFEADLLAEVPDFSAPEVEFYSQKLPLGLKIGLEWAQKTQFSWRAATGRGLKIDGEKFKLTAPSNRLTLWRDVLMVMKLAGVDIWQTLDGLRAVFAQNAPHTATANNQSKQLALFLAGKLGLILSADDLGSVGQAWRMLLETNAHHLCFNQTISEVNFSGWSAQPIEKPFAVIDVIGDFTSPSNQQAFLTKNRLLSGKMPASRNLMLNTKTAPAQLLEMLLLAEATSLYLAALNKQSLGNKRS